MKLSHSQKWCSKQGDCNFQW